MEKTVELLMKNASLLDVELVPSVDKDTQGFRSQTARHPHLKYIQYFCTRPPCSAILFDF